MTFECTIIWAPPARAEDSVYATISVARVRDRATPRWRRASPARGKRGRRQRRRGLWQVPIHGADAQVCELRQRVAAGARRTENYR